MISIVRSAARRARITLPTNMRCYRGGCYRIALAAIVCWLLNGYNGVVAAPSQVRLEQATTASLAATVASQSLAGPATNVVSSTRSTALAPSLLPLFDSGLRLGPALPSLLGLHEPKTYLILVQNNHELRATGGFISALGTLTLDKGRVAALDFTDSYNLYRDDAQYPLPPAPMQRYMGIPLLLLRDANWSPDLPTTAKLIRALYAQDTGVMIDGLVTIDLHAVELIIDALGALDVSGASAPVNGANIIEQIKQFWTQPLETGDTITSAGLGEWWGQRKDFMPALAQAALQQVQAGNVDYLGLLGGAQTALDERAIQIWLTNPTAAAQMAAMGWDGSLQPEGDTDFLALVDTNMGYNKVNAVVTRSLDYTVAWPADAAQPAIATLTVTYTHPITQPDPVCAATPYYGETYDDMIERCFFNYVRLYAPGASQLASLDGVQPDSITTTRGEHGLRIFAGYFVLRPGEQKTITFRYQLPAYLTPTTYALIVQRQSGSSPLPLHILVADQTLATTLVTGKLRWPQ